jgi:general secretion pathway protein F/type IV pilus assembly protein PilC
MAQFQYTARNATGEKISGAMEADNESIVLRFLDEKNLFPISVLNKAARRSASIQPLRLRVRARDVGIMYGQLADLIGSGVPLLRALDSLVRSTVSPRLKEILKEVRKAVADGQSLTDAFKEYPKVFPPLHTAMVQAGERADFLEDVLRSLSGFLERLEDLRSNVIGAMTYPALLSFAGITVMIGALVMFVPKFEPLLEGIDKPLPTLIVFGLSHFIRAYWYLAALGLAGLVALVWTAVRSPRGIRLMEVWRLKIPVVGLALRMVAITRFCRILGTMLANGVPILQALTISKNATGSTLMADRIAAATENVREGKSLTEPLAEGGLFPDQVLAMLTVAEESNRLDGVLLQIADTIERRTNRQVDQAVRLVEPVILCLVAMGIGFLAMGLLLPVFTMASALGK